MTEHLPECLTPMDANRGFWLCICKELRACEKRAVLHAELRWKADMESSQQLRDIMSEQHLPECLIPTDLNRGFWLYNTFTGLCICKELHACEERVLNAAREAVGAALSHEGHCKVLGIRKNCKCSRFDALAVIDALRKDSDD